MVWYCNTIFLLVWIFIFLSIGDLGWCELYNVEKIEYLVKQWSPLLWLSPEEKYMPSTVQEFLENVNVVDGKGNILAKNLEPFVQFNSKTFFLVPKIPLDLLKTNTSSFLHGRNPQIYPVSVYAVITHCKYPTIQELRVKFEQNSIENDEPYFEKKRTGLYPKFHVTYWTFYPYNEGKDVCFIGKVPTPTIFTGKCYGHLKKIGNHVGDWEHVSLYFNGEAYPEKLFLSVHDAGSYYTYDPKAKVFKFESKMLRKGVAQVPKFPPFVRVQGGHPVLFSAKGSHGIWSSPGNHEFIRFPKIIDENGFGTPWKTWMAMEFYHHGVSNIPHWMAFKGRWGTAKNKCLLSRRIGLCEYTEGPLGLLRDIQDFNC